MNQTAQVFSWLTDAHQEAMLAGTGEYFTQAVERGAARFFENFFAELIEVVTQLASSNVAMARFGSYQTDPLTKNWRKRKFKVLGHGGDDIGGFNRLYSGITAVQGRKDREPLADILDDLEEKVRRNPTALISEFGGVALKGITGKAVLDKRVTIRNRRPFIGNKRITWADAVAPQFREAVRRVENLVLNANVRLSSRPGFVSVRGVGQRGNITVQDAVSRGAIKLNAEFSMLPGLVSQLDKDQEWFVRALTNLNFLDKGGYAAKKLIGLYEGNNRHSKKHGLVTPYLRAAVLSSSVKQKSLRYYINRELDSL